MKIRNGTKKRYIEVQPGGVFNYAYSSSNKTRGRVVDEGRTTPTIDTSAQIGYLERDGKKIRARRLTPKECFRLQGVPDELYEKATIVSSENQLYKQAGNSVTVNVIETIASSFKEL